MKAFSRFQVRHKNNPFFLILYVLLLAGCATEQPITIPALRERLPDQGPVAVVEPLVTVYREMPYETVLDREKAQKADRMVFAVAREILAARGWSTIPVTGIDWRGLYAGYSLAELSPAAAEPISRVAAAVLRQLDLLGERLRVHHRPENIPHVEAAVNVGDLPALAPEAGSFLFLTVTGCFGRVSEGPCRNIQFPPPRHDFDDEFKNVLTVPFGMAIRAYWIEAASGRLLWYDDFSRYNLDPGSGKDLKVLVETGLAGFPSSPKSLKGQGGTRRAAGR